ncbi:hypothetical protein BDN72DRAFT_905014, partial [Pluteus cervinus]
KKEKDVKDKEKREKLKAMQIAQAGSSKKVQAEVDDPKKSKKDKKVKGDKGVVKDKVAKDKKKKQRSSSTKPRIGTSWMRALAKAVLERAETDEILLLPSTAKDDDASYEEEEDKELVLEIQITSLSSHLDSLADLLNLLPVDEENEFTKTLKPISQEAIKPVHLICPQSSYQTETSSTCNFDQRL